MIKSLKDYIKIINESIINKKLALVALSAHLINLLCLDISYVDVVSYLS